MNPAMIAEIKPQTGGAPEAIAIPSRERDPHHGDLQPHHQVVHANVSGPPPRFGVSLFLEYRLL